MDMERLKEWVHLTSQYQQENFWNYFSHESHQNSDENPERVPGLFFPQHLFPHCDVYEFENKIVIEAELPGMKEKDISIAFQKETLIIRGECKTLKPKRQYYLKERPNRTFEKKVTIPVKIEKDKIHSSLKNGLLTVYLPIKQGEKRVPIPIIE